MSAPTAGSHAIETTMLPGTYSSQDGTARSAHRAKTATSHIRDASFGDDVGSRALQDAVVHSGDKVNYLSLKTLSRY